MKNKHEIQQLASDHVEWFLRAIKPLLIDHMVHGYKHGFDDANREKPETKPNKFEDTPEFVYKLVRQGFVSFVLGAQMLGVSEAKFNSDYIDWILYKDNAREAQF